MKRLHDEDKIQPAGCLACGRLTLENPLVSLPGPGSENRQYAYMHDACMSKLLKALQKLALEQGTPLMIHLGKMVAKLGAASFRSN